MTLLLNSITAPISKGAFPKIALTTFNSGCGY